MPSPSYIEISTNALRHNVALFRRALEPATKLAGVVKANAYGHGAREVAAAIYDVVDYLMVDDLLELRDVRTVVKTPAIVIGHVPTEEVSSIYELNATLCVLDPSRLPELEQAAAAAGATWDIHLAVDVLLGREGVTLGELPQTLKAFADRKHLRLTGLYGHFANIEDTTDTSHARKQIATFERAVALARKTYPQIVTHISATSGVLAYERKAGQTQHDIVRLGIGLYGMWPSEDLRRVHEGQLGELQPALRWVTHVAQVKELPTGHPVGYGLSYHTSKPTRTALIPQGYSDGYDRGLSNRGSVLIRGVRCPVIGRVAMNMFVVDVTHVRNVVRDDEVVLLGDGITAEELAGQLGTINYEVTTRISPLLPRVVRP